MKDVVEEHLKSTYRNQEYYDRMFKNFAHRIMFHVVQMLRYLLTYPNEPKRPDNF